jgi:hypothetical protein
MASEIQKVQQSAQGLVTRSRLGDQNAIAMIMMIRESAAKGSKRAVYTLKYLTEYVKKHPVKGDCRIGFGCDPMTQRVINAIHSSIGAEPSNHAPVIVKHVPKIENPALAAVPLANCGSLLHPNNPRIKAICVLFTDDQIDAFEYGRENCFEDSSMHGDLTPEDQAALHIGKTVGIAQRIQAVRLPNTPVAILSPMAAWELGE